MGMGILMDEGKGVSMADRMCELIGEGMGVLGMRNWCKNG